MKNKNITKGLLTLLLTVIALTLTSNTANAQSLKDAYRDYFRIGVAVNQRNVTETKQQELICSEYNSITAENDMKPASLHPAEGVWNFERADRIANFCRDKGIKMRGHCLCWHSQFADWMFTDSIGQPASKELFYSRLREHIHTVVTRYKDIVYCWDVVNEAITDNPADASSPYRNSRHWQLCGEEFIAKAFEFAHEADPEALLFYNDYNECQPGKSDRIYNMVKSMQQKGIPIHGIGMQGHYNIYSPSEEELEKAINKYSELVKHIHITELDVRTNMEQGGALRFSRGDARPLPDSLKSLQEQQYVKLFKVFRKHSDVIDCVTFWNLSDRDSWLGTNNHALPFDENYTPKDVYYKILNFVNDK